MTGKTRKDSSPSLVDRLTHAMEQWEHESPQMEAGLLEMIAAFAIIGQQIEIDFRDLAQKIGNDLRVGDLRVLLVLRRSGPEYSLRAIDLGRELLVTSGAITKQIGRLEDRALVVRTQSTTQRGWKIGLTKKGIKVADEIIRLAGVATMPSVLRSIDGEERAVGLRFLLQVLGRMEVNKS